MRILGAIVLPLTALMAVLDPEIAGDGAIRAQVVRDHPIWKEAVFLQKLAHQVSAQHACFAWTGPAHREPRLQRRQRTTDKPNGHRFSGRLRPNAKSCRAWGSVRKSAAIIGPKW